MTIAFAEGFPESTVYIEPLSKTISAGGYFFWQQVEKAIMMATIGMIPIPENFDLLITLIISPKK
jgi:hypothetical protein